ncbi:unnamed protein product [Caenorhabditis auriculariae]|uniref:Secreted protein n=1 Tax=Caenorhabditis auriculariae TaxID=2777116 RepID=A0A8S1HYF3_9PELO|nr:unnamed protein product [Caenorhabditis auriculariae]
MFPSCFFSSLLLFNLWYLVFHQNLTAGGDAAVHTMRVGREFTIRCCVMPIDRAGDHEGHSLQSRSHTLSTRSSAAGLLSA